MNHLVKDMPFCELRRRLGKFGIYYCPDTFSSGYDRSRDMYAVRIMIQYVIVKHPGLKNNKDNMINSLTESLTIAF